MGLGVANAAVVGRVVRGVPTLVEPRRRRVCPKDQDRAILEARGVAMAVRTVVTARALVVASQIR